MSHTVTVTRPAVQAEAAEADVYDALLVHDAIAAQPGADLDELLARINRGRSTSFRLTPAKVAAALDALEQHGFATRTPDPCRPFLDRWTLTP